MKDYENARTGMQEEHRRCEELRRDFNQCIDQRAHAEQQLAALTGEFQRYHSQTELERKHA
jgi:phage-related tail protein